MTDTPIPILRDDPAFLVCIKPFGCLSEKSGHGSSLPDMLEAQLRKNGETVDLYPVHRLDKEAGGVMVYAKTKESAAFLSERIRTGQFEKTYFAEVTGHVSPTDGELHDLLFHDRRTNKTFVVERARKGVKSACLTYAVAETRPDSDVVRIRLGTGRTHQIRVQFAHRGHPLLGDVRYGGGKADCLHLWSTRLCFPGKDDRQNVFFAPPPFFPSADAP